MNSTTGEGDEPPGRPPAQGLVRDARGAAGPGPGPEGAQGAGPGETGSAGHAGGTEPESAPGRVQQLHAVLAGAGVDLTPGELADVLWLALAQGSPGPPAGPDVRVTHAGLGRLHASRGDALLEPRAGLAHEPRRRQRPSPRSGRGSSHEPAPATPPPPERDPGAPVPAADRQPGPAPRRPVYALAGTRPGSDAAPVRVPGVPGLPNPLDVVRALRPLKRRVSSLHRYELDEAATAEAIADSGGPGVVLRPERARWLDLVLAVDDGTGLRVWQDTLAELTRVLGTSGIFRTVRRVGFATTPVNSAVVDGDRTAVLAVTDGVGPAWRSGAAHRTLAAWARKAPTAVLHPLPLRLWQSTALPAERRRVRSGRPAPANHLLRAYDPWLPPHLAAPLELPVPVLELGDWSLGPWASLIASHGGSADLHVVDAAAPAPPPPRPASAAAPAERLLAFQETVSPEAYELAAHLASVDPLTLPVMRVVQSAALPGTSPSCLAEVLLSGLMRVDAPLAGSDVFTFDPDVRALLRTAVPATDARRTVGAVTAYVAERLGRAPDFPALIATRTGTLALPGEAAPFAELPAPAERAAPAREPDPHAGLEPHPSERYVVGVWDQGQEVPRSGYLVAEGLVLTAVDRRQGQRHQTAQVGIEHAGGHGAEPAWLVAVSGEALLYRLDRAGALPVQVPPLLWGHMEGPGGPYGVTVACAAYATHTDPVQGELQFSLDRSAVRAEAGGQQGDAPPAGGVPPVAYHLDPPRLRMLNLGLGGAGATVFAPAATGAAVFDGDALCGVVVGPGGEPGAGGGLLMLPTPGFALREYFNQVLGSPRMDLHRTGTPPSEPPPPRPRTERPPPPGAPGAPRSVDTAASWPPVPRAYPYQPPGPSSAPPPAAPSGGMPAARGQDGFPPADPSPLAGSTPYRPGGPVPPPGAAAPAGDGTPGLTPPPPPGGTTPDEADALDELERAALPEGARATGVLVLRGPAPARWAVATTFAAEHARDFSGVLWYRRTAHPLPSVLPGRDEAPLLVVLADGEDEILLPQGDGLLVLALGDGLAGRGYQEIRIGPGPAAERAEHPLRLTPAPPPGRSGGQGAPPQPPASVAGDLPGQILDDLPRLLPCLAPGVPFDILEFLWPPGPLTAALGAPPGEQRPLEISWGSRQVSLPAGQAGRGDPRGRELALRMLLRAYGEEAPPHRPRRPVGPAELARHVVAFAAAVPPGEDDEYGVRLFARAARHLFRYGDARTAVRLGERVLSYLERSPSGGARNPPVLESRAELARLAVDSGLDAFLALSGETAAAYAFGYAESQLVDVHRRLAAALEAYGSGRGSALPAFEQAIEWAVDTFGRFDPLTQAIQSTASGLAL
ncbi:SAV_2336 N-terminal domain-related protein [Streptomyces sp. NPDC020983]|uniref:SAV_2336 N-terminal domain-related protein n=1 Tax=Streptomyces sp. NPDC020983 TaxID=3365106 RepID=UPI00378A9A75